MEVKIRGVNPIYVSEIDRKAKLISEKTGKKFSKNDYYKMLLKENFEADVQEFAKTRYEETIEKIIKKTEQQNELLEQHIALETQLLKLLISE